MPENGIAGRKKAQLFGGHLADKKTH